MWGFGGIPFLFFDGLLDLEKCLGLDPDDFLREVGGGCWGTERGWWWDSCGDILKVKIDGACTDTNFGRWICKGSENKQKICRDILPSKFFKYTV